MLGLGLAPCSEVVDPQTCSGLRNCQWDGTRTACVDVCQALTDAAACGANRFCVWSSCTGKPVSCSEYSVDDCPEDLGCSVDNKYEAGLRVDHSPIAQWCEAPPPVAR